MGLTYAFIPGRRAPRFDEIQRRIRSPFVNGAGPAVVRIMRQGPGSVGDQFERQATMDGARTLSWVRTKPFGIRQPGPRTLYRRGQLLSAWTGRSGHSTARVLPKRVVIGVSGLIHAVVFQRRRDTVVRARRVDRRGRFVMQTFLGLVYGVWASARRLARGFRIPPRRVAISEQMQTRARAATKRYILTGRAL